MFVKTQGEGAKNILPVLRWIKRVAPSIKQYGFRLKIVPVNDNTRKRLNNVFQKMNITRLPTLIVSSDEESVILTGNQKIQEFYKELVSISREEENGNRARGGRYNRFIPPRQKTIEDENLDDTRNLLVDRYGLFDQEEDRDEGFGEANEKAMMSRYAESMNARKERMQNMSRRPSRPEYDDDDDDSEPQPTVVRRHRRQNIAPPTRPDAIRSISRKKPPPTRSDNVGSARIDEHAGVSEAMLQNARRKTGDFNAMDDELERALYSKIGAGDEL